MENSQEQVRARITDAQTGVVYLVTAWRPITLAEAKIAIAAFKASHPTLQGTRGQQIEVKTIIGLTD